MELLRKYNQATTILFPLIDAGTTDFEITPATDSGTDCEIIKDEGATTTCTNDFVHEGRGIYSLALTATEMTAARIVVTIVDDATKAFEDQAIIISTYGNASAEHAFDLDTASTAQTGDSYAIVNSGTFGNAQLVRSTTPANALDVNATGEAGIDLDNTSGTLTSADITSVAGAAVTSLGADVLTAAAIADNAFSNEHFAAGALTSAEITSAAGCVITTNNDKTGYQLSATGVDAIWDEVLDAGSHNVANSSGKRIRDIQETGAVYGGFIWIDTINGTAGTDAYVNGTSDNPVSTINDANTLAASVGIDRFQVSPGSTITFIAGQTNEAFYGIGWTLALGGQDISGSAFFGADVSGTGTNTTGNQYFINCDMGTVTLPTDTHCLGCGLSGTQTMGEVGDFFYDSCHSSVAGSGSITIDFNTPATETNLNVRHHSGGWTVANMGAGAGTCNASFEGNGQIVWAATCAATSNAAIRGNWKITDNASGAVTETLDDNQTVVDAVKVKTDQITFTKANEVDANVQSINGAGVVGDGNATPWDGA